LIGMRLWLACVRIRLVSTGFYHHAPMTGFKPSKRNLGSFHGHLRKCSSDSEGKDMQGVPDIHYSGGRSGRRTRVAGGRRDALWSSLVPGSVCREDCLSVIARSALSDEDVAV
jgi:hypothetical protein